MNSSNIICEIEKLLNALEQHDALAQRKLLKQKDVKSLLIDFDKNVLSLLEYDSNPYRTYEIETKSKSLWWEETFSDMATKDNHEKIINSEGKNRLLSDFSKWCSQGKNLNA